MTPQLICGADPGRDLAGFVDVLTGEAEVEDVGQAVPVWNSSPVLPIACDLTPLLRRSELVGLDWQKLGEGDGYLVVDERGIVVTLAKSKSSQAEAASIVVPIGDMPAACDALTRWVELASLLPGQPVFRRVYRSLLIGASRLTDHSVSRIVKERMRLLAMASGKTEAEARELVQRFCGHSMRAGYAISAAAADVPGYRIKQHTRHKSDAMVSRYIRETNK